MKELKILNYARTIPFYENKHTNPYATIIYISPRGIRRVAYLEEGTTKNNLLLVNDGTLYNPKLKLFYTREK